MSPKDETCAVNIPAFLSKLWKIVNDPDTDKTISWSPDGRSFIIEDQAQFWYQILPIYYKHNNMSSFVRQLNMYGFHKMHADGKEKDHDELKFYHPFFRKGQPSLMKNIKRKITTAHRSPVKTEIAESSSSQQVTNFGHMTKVLVDVKQLQTRQESVDNQLASMKKENAALWRELALLRQKHMKQQQLVNKLIHFLVHIVNPSRGNMSGRKRKFPLMINDIAGSSKTPKRDSSSDDGIIIHEVENEYILPVATPPPQEEAFIDSPDNENFVMDTQDEFLDIPMTDEIVDSPDSICPDDILAEEPDLEELVEVIEPQITETTVAPALIDMPDLLAIPVESVAVVPDVESTIEDKSKKKSKEKKPRKQLNLSLATRPTIPESKAIALNSPDDFENHLEATQEELDSIKELLLDGYTLDPNTVLNFNRNIFTDMPLQLFMSDDNLPQDVVPSTSKSTDEDLNFPCDPMVSGSSTDGIGTGASSSNQLMPYSTTSTNLLDFENLFENDTSPESTMDPSTELMDLVNMAENQSTLNTPVQIKIDPPKFPSPNTSTSNK